MRVLLIHNKKLEVKKKIKNTVQIQECYYKKFTDESTSDRSIRKYDFFLILAECDEVITQILQKMESLHICEEQYFIYKDYHKNLNDKYLLNIDAFLHKKMIYNGLVLGMSHAKDGIISECFDNKLYNLAIPSIDLYYISKIVNILIREKKVLTAQYIIIELPYYIFNWDISKSNKAFEKFNLLHYFNDYHHFCEMDGGNLFRKRILQTDDIMRDNILQFDFSASNNAKNIKTDFSDNVRLSDMIISGFDMIKKNNNKDNLVRRKKACQQKYGIWEKFHLDTINENKEIWRKIVHNIRRANPDIKIYIAVLPQNPYFIKLNKLSIDKMKKLFYKIIKMDNELMIIDNFILMKRFEIFFKDECHLDKFGAYMYSLYLNRKIKNLRQEKG